MGSQIDPCFFVIYKDNEGKFVYKSIAMGGAQPLCGVLANKDQALLIGGID